MTPASFLWAEEAASTQPAPIAIVEPERTAPVSFADEILPILRKSCLACHNAAEAESELVLETPEAIRKGGAEGPVVVPGKGAESRLVQLAAAREQPAMPPAGNKVGATALSSEELGLLKLWIDQGAAGGGPAIARVVPRRSLPSGLQPIFAAAITSDDQFVAVNRGARLFAYHLPGMRLAGELADPALAGEPGKHAAHEDLIRSLAFDRGGDLLASGGFRTVKLWRRPRSVLEREIAVGQPAQVFAVSADGGWLAVGLSNGEIELRSLAEEQPTRTLAGHTAAVGGLVFSADGARLYSASSDKTLRAWTTVDWAPVGNLTVPAEVRALASINDGSQLAAGDADNVVRIWSAASIAENAAGEPPQPVRELKGHSQPVTALAAAGGERLLSGGADGRMKLWNTATGEMLRDFDHGGPVVAVAVRPDGRRFASAGANGAARLWNPDDGAMLAEIKGDPRAAQALARGEAAANYARACIEYRKEEHREAEETLKRETTIVEGAHKAKEQADKTLAEKTEKSAKAVEARTATEATASAMAAVLQTAADKKSAAQAALDESDKAVKQATAAVETARAAAEKDKENKDLAAARETAEKALADSRAKKQAAEAALKPAVDEFREAERKSQEAKRAANEAANRAKGPERELQEARSALVGAVNFIATAAAVLERAKTAVPATQQAVAGAEALLATREAEKKMLAEAAQTAPPPLRAIAFSADSAQLAIAGEAPPLRLYDAESGAPLEVLAQASPVQALAGSADGRFFAARADGKIAVWKTAASWMLEGTIGRPDDPDQLVDRVLALDFSPDGKLLATGGGIAARYGQLKIWNVADGALAADLSSAHRDAIYGLKFSPDGQFLATASADRLMRVFRIADGALVRTFEGHSHHVLGVCWRPDGALLASCGGDQTIKLWNFETGAVVRTLRGDTYQLGDYKREVNSIAFIGDTEHLLASSGDRTVRMHRTSSQRDVRAFKEGAAFMQAAVATSDGKLVLGGGRDGILHVWNGESGYPVHAFKPEQLPAR